MKRRFSASISGAILLIAMSVNTACAKEEAQSSNAYSKQAAVQAAVDKKIAQIPTYNIPSVKNSDWRDIDQENSLYITTKHGVFVIELAPEIAPLHVAQIKKLARQKFYDDITFHRVISGFMNQTGDPKGDGTGDSSLPNIKAEFTFRRAPDLPVTLVGREMSKQGEVNTGFFKSLPIASKPISQAMFTKDNKVDAWGLHCNGTTSMARGGHDVNSGNSQFFLMRAEYTSLNSQYSIWGMTVWGRQNLAKIKIGTYGETINFVPDMMDTVRVGADVPTAEQLNVQVLKTDGDAFQAYLNGLKNSRGVIPKACNIVVPSRLKP